MLQLMLIWKELKWIDLKTRAVFVDFAFFNPSLNFFVVTRILAEFQPTGVVRASSSFRTIFLDRQVLGSSALTLQISSRYDCQSDSSR